MIQANFWGEFYVCGGKQNTWWQNTGRELIDKFLGGGAAKLTISG
jgi:hypothetical protein